MKSYLTEWKKFKTNTLIENVSSVETLVATNPTAAANDAADKKRENEQLLRAKQEELKSLQKQKATIIPDKIKQLENEIANLMASIQQEAKGYGFAGQSEGSVVAPVSVQEEELTEEELEEASGCHEGLDEAGKPCNLELQYEEVEEQKQCNECRDCTMCGLLTEAKYKGRKVTLNKPMRGDVKKFKVFVRVPSTGNIKKVNFGDKKMRIKKSNPKRRKSFRARHRCSNPGPKTKARYWSCRKW